MSIPQVVSLCEGSNLAGSSRCHTLHVNDQPMNDLMSLHFFIPFESFVGDVKDLTASHTAESRGLEPQCYHPLVFETRTIALMVLLSLIFILIIVRGEEEYPQRINVLSPEPFKYIHYLPPRKAGYSKPKVLPSIRFPGVATLPGGFTFHNYADALALPLLKAPVQIHLVQYPMQSQS